MTHLINETQPYPIPQTKERFEDIDNYIEKFLTEPDNTDLTPEDDPVETESAEATTKVFSLGRLWSIIKR